jgi:peptide/nickel transport system substrate-binding protein
MSYQLNIRFKWPFISVFFIVTGLLCCSCQKKKPGTVSSDKISSTTTELSFPREQSLYIGGFQWGPPSSFNPFAVTPAWPVTGNVNLMYEAMFGYNLIDGKLYGILGTSYSLRGNVLTVKLNKHAVWSNGDSVTSSDVVYTFDIHRKYTTSASLLWNYISDVRPNGPHTVLIELNKNDRNPLIVQNIVASLPILPRKFFTEVENRAFRQAGEENVSTAPDNNEILAKIREFKNDSETVVSGPYTLHSYTDERIVLKRRDTYWGNRMHRGAMPAPVYIIHQSYPSNNEYNAALENGDLDISATFFPQIWSTFSKGIQTWYPAEPYYIPGAIPSLYMGLSKAPLNDPVFRRAVAYAIDYESIRNQAMFGYSPKLTPGLILPFGPEKRFYSDKESVKDGIYHDPSKARSLLREKGYSWGKDSLLVDPSGRKIRSLFIQCPQGWTDWETTISIVAAGMRTIGIDIQEKFVDYAVWDDELKRGMFDFTMKTPHPEQTLSLPWSRFEQVMSSKDLLPVGEIIYHNEGRYQNPVADQLLSKIPLETKIVKIRKLYSQLNNLFISELPVIPLMYRPWLFYQFNTKYWTNFPSESNPYAPPQCLMVGAGIQGLWGIKMAK